VIESFVKNAIRPSWACVLRFINHFVEAPPESAFYRSTVALYRLTIQA